MKELGLADNVERLLTVNVKGTHNPALLARLANRNGSPPILEAARCLRDNVKRGEVAILTSGYPIKASVTQGIFDSDGPIGAITLARAVSVGLKGIPVLVSEPNLVEILRSGCRAAGLFPCTFEEAQKASEEEKPPHVAVVMPFPLTDEQESRALASEIFGVYDPRVLVACGKKGVNEKGVWHNHLGRDASFSLSKVDFLFDQAPSQGVASIGIGDNYINVGFGAIRDEILSHFPESRKCSCPCGGTMVCSTKVDVLVASTISNWGAYGVEAVLSYLTMNESVLHDSLTEERVATTCAQNGLYDATTATTDPKVDGVSYGETGCFLDILRLMARRWRS